MHTIENTLFTGKVWFHLPEVESTNLYALDLISKSNPSEGTVISADNQTAGRGQLGSSWHSDAGMNLMMSLILRPVFLLPRRQFLLNQSISLGVCDFVKQTLGQRAELKWPNDVYMGKRKLGGILIQNNISPERINSSVVGIGINVNQRHFSESIPNPISLALLADQLFSLPELLESLCKCLEARYLQLKSGQLDQLQQDYLHHLYLLMEDALFRRPDGTVFNGRITGITEIGKLKIHHQAGEETFGMKEIQFV